MKLDTPLNPVTDDRVRPPEPTAKAPMAEQWQFIATAGFAVTVVLALSILRSAAPHAPGDHPLHTLEWLAVAVFMPAFVTLEWVSRDRARHLALAEVWNASRPFLAAAYVLVAAVFVMLDGGAILFIIALAQALIVYVLARRFERTLSWTLWTYGASLASWVFTANLSFTPLEKLLLNASPATALIVPVFSAALCLLLCDLALPFGFGERRPALATAARYIIAGLIFAELALRTDAGLMDWVPYHQMYWVGPATFVREGHFLLWDVPSQYGFLSELLLAVFPGRTVWQSLYEVTALVLVVQALLLFGLLTANRKGLLNFFVAILVCSAIFFSSQASRYPFGPRLYPQAGLRFIWVIALLFIAYKIYATNNARSKSNWRTAGWVCWGIATLWAFESLVWGTFAWGGFIALECAVWAFTTRPGLRPLVLRLVYSFVPFVLIGTFAIGAVDAFYYAHLGHGPDWTGYLEFSALYAADSRYHVVTETFGPGWLIVMLLGALAVPAIYALRARRYEALPILAACWLATWSSAAYYVGEPYDNHVSALTMVFGFVYAIASLIMARLEFESLAFSRLAFVPLFALLITTAYGEPSRIAQISAPLMPGYRFDAANRLPAVSGELAQLVRKAGIGPGDHVIFPNSPSWVKLDDGMIAPFIKDEHGNNQELVGWLPASPAGPKNTLYSLPIERRLIYIHRYLQLTPRGGWYIVFHGDALCERAAPEAVNVGPMLRTTNYSAAKCGIGGAPNVPFVVRKVVNRK